MNYLITDLEKVPFIRHGFFTRHGGVSAGLFGSLNCGLKNDEENVNVRENRARVAAALDLPPEKLVIAKQVHGNVTLTVTKPWGFAEGAEADAMVTAKAGIALGVLTADCAPVLFVDKKARVIGAAHAGWKGAVGGILESTIEAMKKLGAEPKNILAAIGPCIGAASYEVKDDFTAPFLAQDAENQTFFRESPKAGHLIFNLPGYVAHRVGLQGVKTIYDTRQDTLAQESVFFSNRRAFLKSEKSFGLQISVISMEE